MGNGWNGRVNHRHVAAESRPELKRREGESVEEHSRRLLADLDDEWGRLVEWSRGLDDRDVSDEANRWADGEAELTDPPKNAGEWKASLAIAFDAGRKFAEMKRGLR